MTVMNFEGEMCADDVCFDVELVNEAATFDLEDTFETLQMGEDIKARKERGIALVDRYFGKVSSNERLNSVLAGLESLKGVLYQREA